MIGGYRRRLPSHILVRVYSSVSGAMRDGMMRFVRSRFVDEELFSLSSGTGVVLDRVREVHPRVARWLITEYNPPGQTRFYLIAASLDPELLSLMNGCIVNWDMLCAAAESGDFEILKYAAYYFVGNADYRQSVLELAIQYGFIAPKDVGQLNFAHV